MKKQTAINIGLHINNQIYDLRIPKLVKKEKLKVLIEEALQSKRIPLPTSWELRLLDKHIHIHTSRTLDDYPLHHGDQLLVQPRKEKQS